MSRHSNGGTSVRNTRTERSNVSCLVTTRQPQIVVFTIDSDVFVVPLGQLFNGGFNVLHSSGLPHRLGAEVAVAASAIPVTLQRLGVEGHLDAPLLSNPDEEVPRHPQMVTHLDSLTRTDLELPLGGHDLGIDATDLDPGIEAGSIVGLDKVTGENLAGTLRSGPVSYKSD